MDKDIKVKPETTTSQSCYQCEGKGYTEIRDCAGEIQRTDTCSFCEGKGYTTPDEYDKQQA